MGSSGKILVIRGGAIGDFILTLPAIAALRQRFPMAHLEVLGYPHIAQLALVGGWADAVRPIEARALAGFFARNGELSEELRVYFSEFDLILSYLYDPDRIFEENVRRCSPAQFLAGPHRPDERGEMHATRVFLQPLERLAIFDADPIPRLQLPRASRGESAPLALHPGSGSDRKNWPEARWADLFQYLLRTNRRPFMLVGGEAEADRLHRLAMAAPLSRIEVCQSLPLADLARRLNTCAAFVGHDSGITHLAAAVGLPMVVLWPDTPVAVWQPLGTRVRLVQCPRGIRSLPVEDVVRAVDTLLEEVDKSSKLNDNVGKETQR
ncbi:MAG: glycosyltransferase family 9 protein [Verrucomicrobiota bacterium]|nr:glycosyltransferase family 9 protein [Limisphaera sp.]MDW8380503.1 glycosyltransferase family 9 protein [Verrucomicrobiota bacterium]